jgi:AcrR family transcriptional regulator
MNPHSSSEKPVRLRERLREATAEAILEAAEEVFATDGPRARMESIAGRAGIAVGTLYNHFSDREALWRELCRSRREALLVRLDEALELSRNEPFEDALRAMLAAFVAHWAAHRGFVAVLMEHDPPTSSPGPRSKNRTMAQEMLDRVDALVRRGAAQGALRPEGVDLYPVLILGMLRSVLFHQLEKAPSSAAAAEVERMLDLFLRGAGQRS